MVNPECRKVLVRSFGLRHTLRERIVFTHSLKTTITLAALFVLGAMQTYAADQPTLPRVDTHVVALEHHVEIANNSGGYEAVAKRFEGEAAQFDVQAAEHVRLAALYRWAQGNPKGGSDFASLAIHCDKLTKTLKAAAGESRKMAQIYHDIAKLEPKP